MTHAQAFELAISLATAGFSCEQTFTKRSPYTTVMSWRSGLTARA